MGDEIYNIFCDTNKNTLDNKNENGSFDVLNLHRGEKNKDESEIGQQGALLIVVNMAYASNPCSSQVLNPDQSLVDSSVSLVGFLVRMVLN